MSEDEFSSSGGRIWRHGERTRPFERVEGDPEAIQRIEAHLERFLGPSEKVWHEIVSDLVHVDVHQFPPREGRDCTVLATTGMSDRPMTVPPGFEDYRHAEVLLCLPPAWPLDEASFKDERNYWPIRLLKRTARFPHEYDTWLGWGHTIPNGDPPEPYAPGVPFSSVLLDLPFSFPKELFTLDAGRGRTIRFFSLIPLHEEELRLKLTKGMEPLEELFDRHRVNEIVDVARPSVARRRWLRLV
jgi:hypothetical protein